MNVKIGISVLIVLCAGILIYVFTANESTTQKDTVPQEETERVNQVDESTKNEESNEIHSEDEKEEETETMIQDQPGVEKIDKLEGEGKVKGTLTISEETNDQQGRELADQYAQELGANNENGIIEVQVVREGKGVTSISYKQVKQDSSKNDLPAATVKTINGLLIGTKEVYVTLDTKENENYSVIVEEKELTYVQKKEQFIAVVETMKSLDELKVIVRKK